MTHPTCPTCGTPKTPDAPEGLCPACLLKAGLAQDMAGATLSMAGAAAAPADVPEDPSPLFPDLEILGVLGRGGMGVVYKARQKQLDRMVALKVLPLALAAKPGFTDRFQREARALARLSHPNIVAIYDFGQRDGQCYLMMELVDGLNLRQMMSAGAITPELALSIVPRVCEALQYAHDEGILHRDIKPENILVDKKGRVKIADFGLAKLTGEPDTAESLTRTGIAMGTPRYMAPEQYTDTKTVDHRADIYSLGVVFYEMLTGQLPIGRFPLPSQTLRVDVRLDEVVLKTLESEPARRYQHASEIKTDVERITRSGAVSASTIPIGGTSLATASPEVLARSAPGLLEPGVRAEGATESGAPSTGRSPWRRRGMGGLLAGCLALAIGVMLTRGPAALDKAAVIIEDPSANEGAASPVHRMFRYHAKAPVDHRASFWVEYWREGKLDKKAGLTGGQMRQLPSRAAFDGGFDFSLADGAKTSPDAAGKVRWDFFVSSRLRDWVSSNGVMKVINDAGRGGHGNWIADPFAGLAVVSSWGKTGKWNVAIGEPVTVLVLRGYATGENLSSGLGEEEAKQGKACILLRARFDAVPPGERVEHSQSKSLIAADVEKLGVPAPKPVVGVMAATVREDAEGGTTNKLFRDFRYQVTAPANTRATFWVELWRDGELDQQPGATGGQSYEPPVGGNFEGPFVFSVADAAEWGPGAAGQIIWDFTAATRLFDGVDAAKNTKFKPVRSDALGAQRKWIGNAFEGLEVRSSWGGKRSWTTIGGEPVTLLVIRGDPPDPAGRSELDEASAKQAKACLLLKVRFDSVRPGDLKSASVTKYLDANAIDPRVEKPAAAPATDTRFVMAQDRAKIPATRTAGREEYAFTLSGPTGHVLHVWAEIWQEGRMRILGGLDYHVAPRGGQGIDSSFALATMDGDVAGVESKGMMRLDWGLDGAWNNHLWVTNHFKGMGAVHCSWDREPRKWNPLPGETVTLLSLTGYKISEFRSAMSVFTEADLIKGWPNAAILVRAQFTPARPGEIRDGEGPSVSTNSLLNGLGSERISYPQFEIAKVLGVDVSRCASPAEAHAVLVVAAAIREGREKAVSMIGEFLAEVGYSTQNPDKRMVIDPMNTQWWRARKGQTVDPEALVTALERFIGDLNTGVRGVWWDRPEPIVKGEHGPQLSPATASPLKLTPAQVAEANAVLQKYAKEARALERRHTKITRDDQGHVLVSIGRFSPECLGLASNLVAELGGIVPQNLLPAVRVGGLPAAVFGSAGECAQEIEMWKEDGKYHLTHRQYDWIPVPGQFRNSSSFSNVGPGIETFYGDYRLHWTEE